MKHRGHINSVLKKTLLAFACSGLLFSCSNNSSAQNTGDDLSHHVIITMLTTGDHPSNGATERMLKKLNEILTEKINAEIQMYYIPWGDYLFNYDVTLAQLDGTQDLVGTASDWLDAWQNAKNGTFLGMTDEMIKKYAPKTYETVSAAHWDMCRMNGKIYLMPEDNFTQWTNQGFMYRMDWAKEAGLPNGVHSWEDLTVYFRYLRETKPDMICWNANSEPSSLHAEGYIQSKSDCILLEGVTTVPFFAVRKSNLNKVYSPFLEGNELVEYAKLMREWENMRVWPVDVVKYSRTESRGLFKEGNSAVDQHHSQTWYSEVVPAIRNNCNTECGFFWFGEESGNLIGQSITHGAMAISAASKNPERALMVYDLIRNDPECYRLFNFGIEGVNYEMTDDGYRKGIKGAPGISTNFWWGRNDSLEIHDRNSAWDAFDSINAIYSKVKIDYPYPQIIWSVENISTELTALNDVWGIYMGNICFGQSSNPEAYVAEFRQKLRDAGIEKVISDLQRQLDEFKASK